ncbi:MAG TPA: hypothetical protein VG106_05350 [Vicinamibacterales bacterium]|nr:hypothetical protein [Vicinamibacterales bacterium]
MSYWQALETEVLQTVMPQYVDAAREMNQLERTSFDVYRRGDLAARGLFALGGLFVGSFLIMFPFVPKLFEAALALLMGGAGFTYPDLKRFMYERRHTKLLNRLVTESAQYQHNSRLHYMTTTDIRESFHLASPPMDEVERKTEAE